MPKVTDTRSSTVPFRLSTWLALA
ncbi:uncharacterized protein FTOL_13355 [Fusarium torulosum]|uniref:Uncharacterized protein n=1 Tax=Fusarium torulosum TaxID=33205 RepID=A0AAE8MNK4_9HYPO|nr:uncharacterized protein FTOL_13355 [Fusarium torulosum]